MGLMNGMTMEGTSKLLKKDLEVSAFIGCILLHWEYNIQRKAICKI